MARRRQAAKTPREAKPPSRQRRRPAARHDRREAVIRIAGDEPAMCWRICKWKALYAAPVEPGSDAEKYAMMYPMQYVRLWCGQTTVEGNYVDAQLAAILAAGGLELLGIAMQLLRMAACRDRLDGRLVDHLGLPASPPQIAVSVGARPRRMQAALKTLSGPRIAFVEQTPSVEVGTPIGLRAAARESCTPKGGDGRMRPAGGSDGPPGPGNNPGSTGDRESRQAGGQQPGTAGPRGTGVEHTPPVNGLPAACGPPGQARTGETGTPIRVEGTPKEQEQEQGKGPEQSAGPGSDAPTETKIGSMETKPRAQARKGTSQPIAEEPIEPTGADPRAAASPGGPEAVIECDDEPPAKGSNANAASDPLTLAVYNRLYPTAQFESTESLKARDGRGLSMRQFRGTEQGAIASGITAAMAGKSATEQSSLWAWSISAAEDVYRRDHRKRRRKPLGSVWLWRLKKHGVAGASGPP